VPTLRAVVDLLHGWYPPATADSWDAVGLVAGDPDQPVRKVLFAVDPAPEVADEAAAWGSDLLVVHHPLFLKPVHGIARTTPKARTLGVLLDAGCALLTAHTNADQAVGGVSEALASALGLRDQSPIHPRDPAPVDKLTVYVPVADADRLREALAAAGAGLIGDYEAASFSSLGEGRFRPLAGADPTIGEVGRLEVVDEVRVEVVLARPRRSAVVAAMLAAHPYEEPAYDVVELAPAAASGTGSGRIGDVEPTTLGDFARVVAQRLPSTAGGVRVGGDPQRPVRRVAVCGGAGDFLLDSVLATDADVYVTSDLRHHPASEFLEKGGPALVDVAHWAAEWTWLPVVEARLRQGLDGPGDALGGDTVETRVSRIPTDPWTRIDPGPDPGPDTGATH
jgi:dinuclear metal center YbgI/SA1388 family protein